MQATNRKLTNNPISFMFLATDTRRSKTERPESGDCRDSGGNTRLEDNAATGDTDLEHDTLVQNVMHDLRRESKMKTKESRWSWNKK